MICSEFSLNIIAHKGPNPPHMKPKTAHSFGGSVNRLRIHQQRTISVGGDMISYSSLTEIDVVVGAAVVK